MHLGQQRFAYPAQGQTDDRFPQLDAVYNASRFGQRLDDSGAHASRIDQLL